jgi:SAM-dependent methyltransferase
VVDLGCGVAGPATDIALAFPAVRITGVTISPVQAALAQNLIRERAVDVRVDVRCGDYHETGLPTAAFDQVFVLECAGYSPDPVALFREACRLLRPGGRLYVKDVHRPEGPLGEVESVAWEAFDRQWALARTPTLREMRRDVETAGLTVTRAESVQVEMDHRWFGEAMLDQTGLLPRLSEFGRLCAPPAALRGTIGEILAIRPVTLAPG